MEEFLQCIECGNKYPVSEVRYNCDCSGLLEYQYTKTGSKADLEKFDTRLTSRKKLDKSGVWRFRDYLPSFDEDMIISHPEGNTRLYHKKRVCEFTGVSNFFLKHEGDNPSGSFKDRGMTVAVTAAKKLGFDKIACASTGNTSAALASYAATGEIRSLVFLPHGKVALGKLSQAIAYGAEICAIKGDFDQALDFVRQICERKSVYLVNSLNPFRLEGQKTIMWEMLQDLEWKAPDWVVVPGGNLGNTSAFGKALKEAKNNGWIDKLPRIAVIQAQGANPFKEAFDTKFSSFTAKKAETIATAIRIGNPVNYHKAKRVVSDLEGVVIDVTEEEIKEAKRHIDRSGIGAEPASACSVAGLKKLVDDGVIEKSATVVGILTGNLMKDPDANASIHEGDSKHYVVEAELSAIEGALGL